MPQMRGQRVIDTSKEEGVDGANVYDYEPFQKVFSIYRPWGGCHRCQAMISANTVTLPTDEGDISCPHTQLKDLNEVRKKGMAGQVILGPEQETVLRDGTIIVSIKWWEPKINYKKQRALKKKLEREVATQSSEDPDPE